MRVGLITLDGEQFEVASLPQAEYHDNVMTTVFWQNQVGIIRIVQHHLKPELSGEEMVKGEVIVSVLHVDWIEKDDTMSH